MRTNAAYAEDAMAHGWERAAEHLDAQQMHTAAQELRDCRPWELDDLEPTGVQMTIEEEP